MFKIGKTLFKSLLGKPATVRYPAEKPKVYERTRGHIEIDIDACIHCGICQRRCPANAIEVQKADLLWSIQRMRCVQCNACVEVCPKKCLAMRPDYTTPSSEPVKDVFTRARVPAGESDHKDS